MPASKPNEHVVLTLKAGLRGPWVYRSLLLKLPGQAMYLDMLTDEHLASRMEYMAKECNIGPAKLQRSLKKGKVGDLVISLLLVVGSASCTC